MPKVFTSDKQKIGKAGEDIACDYLKKAGFSILEQNYTKKWGELDIIAEKDSIMHFIEVKSVSRPNRGGLVDNYKPEDNIHPWKVQRLSRAIQTYLLERNVPENKNWQFDICAVYLDSSAKSGEVILTENIIL